jgi:yecA family protein
LHAESDRSPAPPKRKVKDKAAAPAPAPTPVAPVTGTARSARYAPGVEVKTPTIETCGHLPFSEQDLHSLTELIRSPAWPHGALSLHAIEGLLTALLVLPIGLRPGAWLPLIWNESGWRVPIVIQDEQQFGAFVERIVGWMRQIDLGLSQSPAQFASILGNSAFDHYAESPQAARRDWVNAFGIAVSQSENFKARPDSVTNRALFAIAMHANPAAARIYKGHQPQPSLQEAVLILAAVRTSRGPLGALPEQEKVKTRP